MNDHIRLAYDTLINNQKRQLELTIELETLLKPSKMETLKFHLQNKEKKKEQRTRYKAQLDEYRERIKIYEEECSTMTTWLKNKSAIPKMMFIELVQFLLSEYEQSEVLIREGNTANDLSRKEILAFVRSDNEFDETYYHYYLFLVTEGNKTYQLPIKGTNLLLFYVLDLETGRISKTATMGHPRLEQGIMEFLNYRIEHAEIDSEQILESFERYYQRALREFVKAKS